MDTNRSPPDDADAPPTPRPDGNARRTEPTDQDTPSDVAVVDGLLDRLDDEATPLVVDPPVWAVRALVTALGNRDDPPATRVLLTHSVRIALRDDFLFASRAAELVEAGHLRLRDADSRQATPLVTTESRAAVVISVPSYRGTPLVGTAADLETVRSESERRWRGADELHLRRPPLSELLADAREHLGPEFHELFREVIEYVDDLDDPTAVHGVRSSVLVGAVTERLHYDLGRWGERTGFASSATFSRHKSALQEAGVIETERQPVELGRPRQRLGLTPSHRELLTDEGVDALFDRVLLDDDPGGDQG